MESAKTEVLVIGAGPTGLFVAAELARHGVRPRIIDQSPTPHTQTRATGVQPGVLEVLHRAGLADTFLASGVPVKGLRVLDDRLAEAFVSLPPATHTPFPHTCSLPQWRTEEILNARLAELGVAVERGVTAENIDLCETGACVTCSAADGRSFTIEADYLVGAGGAHSPVRGALRERLEGITYPRRFLVADAVTTGVHRGDSLISVAISPAGMIMLAELPAGRTLIVTDLPDDVPCENPGLDDLRQSLARHLATPLPVSDLRWISVYRCHRRMSPTFAQGPCLLAGDAAHICSPLGGEGMNAGLLDAATLAWQLAGVLRLGGTPRLLAAYAPEREQVARQVLGSSESMHDFYYGMVAMAAAGQPVRQPPPDPTRQTTSTCMLDVAFPESPILGFHGTALGVRTVKPGCRFPDRARLAGCRHHLLVYRAADRWDDAAFARRWGHVVDVTPGERVGPAERAGVSPAGAVLVRPDGHIGFQAVEWTAPARDALEALLAVQFAPRN